MSDQEPFETMMGKIGAAVLRDLHPQVVEAEQAAKQARADLRDRFAMAALIGIYANPGTNPKAYFSDDCAQEIWAVAEKMMKARAHD